MTDHHTEAKPLAELNQELRHESDTPDDGLQDSARAQLTAGQEKLRETTDQIGTKMREADERVHDGVGTARRQGEEFVRDNPGIALAGALGVGVLLGMALRDRH